MDTWKPKLGEIYWRMNLGGLPELSKYTGSGISQEDYKLGNCYPSLKACEVGDDRVDTTATSFELSDLSAIHTTLERIVDLLEKNCKAIERIATVQEKNRRDNEGTPYNGIDGY
jgi:hypothetical protein